MHYHEVNVPESFININAIRIGLVQQIVDMVYKIEILHVHYAIPHAYAGYMAKQMLKDEGIEIPMVTTLHGTDIFGNHPFINPPLVLASINRML
jgi:predicted RNA methylase